MYTLAYLAVGSLPWQGESDADTELMKREVLRDSCQLRHMLTGSDVTSGRGDGDELHDAADALQTLWAEVVRCRGGKNGLGASVDYDACLAALHGVRGGEEEEVKAPLNFDI